MITKLDNQQRLFFQFINKTVRLRIIRQDYQLPSYRGMETYFNQLVDTFQNLLVVRLPVKTVGPCRDGKFKINHWQETPNLLLWHLQGHVSLHLTLSR